MKVLIVGAGAVGYHLAGRLADEAQSVTIVDPDPARIQRVADNLDVLAVRGSGSDLVTLEEAGIAGADLVAAVSGVDEVNLLACLTASRFDVPIKVARVRHPGHYRPGSRMSPEVVGVDFFISPVQECAQEILELLTTSAATDLAHFADGRVQLVGTRLRPGGPLSGRSVIDLDREFREHRFVLAAVVRDGATRIPTGSTVLEAGDKIFVLAPSEEMAFLPLLSGEEAFQLGRVMIAGGSGEAVHLARALRARNVHCTILERDAGRSRELAEILPGALILHGDATDLELLEMEGVEGVDGFVALTERDEVNMLVALLAKSLNARRVITLVHKPEYMNLVERVGLDAAVSPRISAANAILRFIRTDPVASVVTVAGSGAQALEVVVEEGSKPAGRLVRDLPFPRGALLGVLIRGDEVILPRGPDRVEVGDLAILFVLPEAIAAVEKMFR